MLGPRRKHPVWLIGALVHQIINQNSNIRFRASEDEWFFFLYQQGSVYPGHQTLRGRFLVPRSSVNLPCEKESVNEFRLQRQFYLVRWKEVVLDRISRTQHCDIFQAGDRLKSFELNFLGQAR